MTCGSSVYYPVLCKNLPQNFMNWINSTLLYVIIRHSVLAQWNWLPAPFCVLSLECQMRPPSPMWCLSYLEPLEDSQSSLLFPYPLCVASLGSLTIRHLAAKRRNTIKEQVQLSIVSRLCCLDSVIQAASHQEDREELQWVEHSERLHRWTTVGTRMLYQQKCGLVVTRLPSLRMVGVY